MRYLFEEPDLRYYLLRYTFEVVMRDTFEVYLCIPPVTPVLAITSLQQKPPADDASHLCSIRKTALSDRRENNRK